mmetsp:Transcript_39629/g.55037  ORF Transcript_39629/g.55037 Transcript_39629/m.55037 type:complete len:207 (+) Transcript_39629:46-666(+)|eukprot:CAMPEP_0196589404 /NCGR_PEP_ID=MMETSP1081-20130531/63450_1 /TAXON_ID=36882 /ORGANISM="Pyramimonas amylifera, Strain CCMP720" /LENGTH=206 /DNA_ID=CAMNT_0041912191 /DNA_START=46 /DNA_END=666 /DNA_ORIENTATION=+
MSCLTPGCLRDSAKREGKTRIVWSPFAPFTNWKKFYNEDGDSKGWEANFFDNTDEDFKDRSVPTEDECLRSLEMRVDELQLMKRNLEDQNQHLQARLGSWHATLSTSSANLAGLLEPSTATGDPLILLSSPELKNLLRQVLVASRIHPDCSDEILLCRTIEGCLQGGREVSKVSKEHPLMNSSLLSARNEALKQHLEILQELLNAS